MTDVVKKLKSSTQWYHADCDMKMKAAAEIERLRDKCDMASQDTSAVNTRQISGYNLHPC